MQIVICPEFYVVLERDFVRDHWDDMMFNNPLYLVTLAGGTVMWLVFVAIWDNSYLPSR
jgi:hypothetical protein